MRLKILKKITNNLYNFTKEELIYIEELVSKNIVKYVDNNITINKKYKIGTLKIQNDIAKVIPMDTHSKPIFIDKSNLLNCYNEDIVIVKMIFNPRGKLKAKIIEVVQKHSGKIVCFIKKEALNAKCEVLSIKDNLNVKCEVLDAKDGDIVIVQNEQIIQILGGISDPKVDELISLYLYNENYRRESYTLPIYQPDSLPTRVDLTHLPFCTIDPVSAKDHDDAIYYDEINSILYVAIADVSAYIKEGSVLDEAAKKRAFSIYLPNKVLPMIPFELSADLCSLKPDVERFAYVLKMEIDKKKLEVKNSELIEAVIISKNKYSYEDIDKQIEQDSLPVSLASLYRLTQKLRKSRLLNGYDFRVKEYRLKLDEYEKLIDVIEEKGSASHKLVEECMLLANKQAANRLNNLGIYRVHDEPDRKKIEILIQDLELLGIKVKLKKDIHSTIISIQQKALNADLIEQVDKLIIQSQQQARYSSQVAPHFGLGFSTYSHFTSPIRRYSDLILHRMLKTTQIPKDIDTICVQISDKEREIARLVWDLEERKYARWANLNLENEFKAVIVDVEDEPKGELTESMLGLRFNIENYSSEQLFSKVKVKIISSDIINKKIVAEIMV